MPLSITSTIRSAGIVVLSMRGPMGRADVESFRAALAAVLRAHRPHAVELDLGGLLDIDPGAAGAVADAVREAIRGGTAVAVVRASTPVRHQLRLAGGGGLLT